MLLNVVLYFLLGFIPSIIYVYCVNKHNDIELTYGDLGFILFLSCFGPIAMIGLILVSVIFLCIRISDWQFWDKPLFRKDKK